MKKNPIVKRFVHALITALVVGIISHFLIAWTEPNRLNPEYGTFFGMFMSFISMLAIGPWGSTAYRR